MTTLFISDLHLCDANPKTLKQFEDFIATQAAQAQALYILGDLFEVWVGDDDPCQAAERVAQALSSLAKAGTKVYYMHGNRDFLLGEKYAQRCQMEILPDPSVIECEGKTILITHGDLLCTDDKSYQSLRKWVHRPGLQKFFLGLPRFLREGLANKLRKQSSKSHQHKNLSMMDANPETVLSWFAQHACTMMVHGHTHQPFHHQVNNTHRYVLGAWDIEPVILIMAGGQIILR